MPSFDPSVTYFHLKDERAEALVAHESFWPSVMAGQRDLDGRLVAGYACEQTASSDSAEVHPAGRRAPPLPGGSDVCPLGARDR